MASTWSSGGLNLRLMTTGENDNTWGDQTNDNLKRLENKITGYAAVTLSGTTHTLTFTDNPTSYADEDGRNFVLNFGGSPGGTCTVTIPARETVYLVLNNTADSNTITLTTGSGTTFNVPAGKDAFVYSDGTNVYNAMADAIFTTITGDGSALTGVLHDVVDDSTPQLGGNLDLNSNNITGTGNIDITGTATVTGLTTTGNINFGDSDKAIFGAGSDLEIFHNGSNSYISDNGTGDLYIRGSSQIRLTNPSATENYAAFNDNGAVSLYYDNSLKLATTSGGIDVTGTATATTFSGSGASLTSIPNAALDNSSITINGTGVSLGGSINVGDITGVTAGNGLTGGGTTGAVTLNVGAGTGIDVSADAIAVDVSDFMTNGSNNRVLTATGTDGMNAEGNMTFDGSLLTVTGVIDTTKISVNAGGNTTDPIIFVQSDTNTGIFFPSADTIAFSTGNGERLRINSSGIDVTGQVLADKAYIAEATLTDGATISWDVSTQSVAKVTLGGNRTISAPSNGSTGQFASLLVIQDGTGSRTLTWNAVYEFKDDTPPTLTSTGGKGDLFVFRYNGTKWLEVGRNLNLTLS